MQTLNFDSFRLLVMSAGKESLLDLLWGRFGNFSSLKLLQYRLQHRLTLLGGSFADIQHRDSVRKVTHTHEATHHGAGNP